MKHPILEKAIVPVINPTENQKAVLSKIVAAATPKLAAADVSANRNLVSARDMLVKLNMIDLDETGAALTDAGTQVMVDQGLTDDTGELTEVGKKHAFGDDPEKRAAADAAAGGEEDMDMGMGDDMGGGEDDMDMDMGMGESLIQTLQSQALTESLDKVPEKLLSRLDGKEQKALRDVIDGKVDFDMTGSLYDKMYDYYVFDTRQMPYGTAKARTGDPDVWMLDQIT